MTTRAAVQAEFDRLAELPPEWDWNSYYHPFLARALPPRIGSLLDVGCGGGLLCRFLAPRCGRVLGIDLSPGMVEQARRQTAPPHVEFAVADFLDADLPLGSFDAIVSVAALHHMELHAALFRMKSLLAPGGTIAILDLFAPETLADRCVWALGACLAPAVRFTHTGRLFPSRTATGAWASHAAYDHYVTLEDLRSTANEVLPNARIRRHVFWRFSLVSHAVQPG